MEKAACAWYSSRRNKRFPATKLSIRTKISDVCVFSVSWNFIDVNWIYDCLVCNSDIYSGVCPSVLKYLGSVFSAFLKKKCYSIPK